MLVPARTYGTLVRQTVALRPAEQDPGPEPPSVLPAPPPPDRDRKRGKAWERESAKVGIWWAFTFLVVPRLFALRTYRRWQRGERERPTGLIVFGILYTVYVAGSSILLSMAPGL